MELHLDVFITIQKIVYIIKIKKKTDPIPQVTGEYEENTLQVV